MSGVDSKSEGRRQQELQKQRDKQREEIERMKEKIIKDTSVSVGNDRFTVQTDDLATALAKDTVGLVSLKDFQAKQRDLEARRAAEIAGQTERAAQEQAAAAAAAAERKKAGLAKKTTAQKKALSFSMDDEEQQEGSTGSGGDEPPAKKFKVGKNPNVDTSFLPDRDRELEEQRERERLALEWRDKQEQIKQDEIEVTFSFWDGSGHRASVRCRKGETIATFLDRAKQQFPEIKNGSVDNLIYIKEDLIIPHYYTFYDFIVNKTRGKSGPLFHFDVHEDIRLVADARVERDESHAGKVCERRWYERNKHIFPASRWEVYDPEKDYGKYTIGDSSKTV